MSAPTFEQIVTFRPAYDRRHTDPSKNYGVHGVDLRMVLKGPAGAVQFVVYTNWHLPHVQAEFDARHTSGWGTHTFCHPLPADVGYHSPVPQYEGQDAMDRECEYTGGVCYYDGSGLQAEEMFNLLVREGSDAVWADLERRYHELFAEVSA